MSVVLVHGMPMTSALWRPLLEHVERDDVIPVDLPGFRDPPPPGWRGTKEEYVDWLARQIELEYERAGPVHVVGHDWGCLLVLRVASLRPELFRSVAAGNGPIDPHWPHHALWRVWNHLGAGERWMDELDPDAISAGLATAGLPQDVARSHSWRNAWNREITLTLYRSATDIGHEWADDLAKIVVPSLLLWGQLDLIVSVEFGRRMAARIGAELVTLDAHHFWPAEKPAEAAAVLQRHWRRAEAGPQTILTQSLPEWFSEPWRHPPRPGPT
jgi:pimeloyl-ACP methyl ester carboxylesterase